MNQQTTPEIQPDKFFTEIVPGLFDKFKPLIPSMSSIKAAICFELTGDQGGMWTLKLDSGTMTGKIGDDPDRIIKIEQSLADWTAAWSGERGIRIELPGENVENYAKNPFLDQTIIDKLKNVSGSIKLKITDAEKGDWEIILEFGPEKTALRPDCVIMIDAKDVEAIRAGKLDPTVAFFAGKINIQGDMGLAIQLGTILTS